MAAAEKAPIVAKYRINELDTGSVEVQVALASARIKQLTEHFKAFKKDTHSRTGLQALVNRRRKLLKYLKSRNMARYQSLIKSLELRDSY